MIVWTINRVDDGPMKAYKNLGEDLMLGDPKIANALINNLASAIIRNIIANSTIDQIIKNREELKAKIISSMKVITIGWGVWLETVEIIDVKISSGTLFKNLQCRFRKDEEKKAQIQSRNANHEVSLKKEKLKYIDNWKRWYDTKKT
jgi:regulator of protease activity HflC (stomatin/prohibitin superfamily)